MKPLPRYQKLSESKRALCKAHAFSSADPFVPITNITPLRNASRKGPERAGDFVSVDGFSPRRHLSPSRYSQIFVASRGQGTSARCCPSRSMLIGAPGFRYRTSDARQATFSVLPAKLRLSGSCVNLSELSLKAFCCVSINAQ